MSRRDQFDAMGLLDLTQGDPTVTGEMRYDAGAYRQRDNVGTYNPRTVYQTPHTQLPSLPHMLGEWCGTAQARVTTGTPFPTSQTWYYDQAMTKKAAQVSLTRLAATAQVSQATTTIYDTDGVTVLGQCVDSYTYSGVFEVKLVRSWTMKAVP